MIQDFGNFVVRAGGSLRTELPKLLMVALAIQLAMLPVHAESLRTRAGQQLRSNKTHIAEGLNAFTWVGRYQVLDRTADGPIGGVEGVIEIGADTGTDPMWIRIWHDANQDPLEFPIRAADLDSEGWATIVVRWDRSRQLNRQEVRVNGRVVGMANWDSSTVFHKSGSRFLLGASNADVRQYDTGLYGRWLTDKETLRFEQFALNVSELASARLWAVMGGFDRQTGKVVHGDYGIMDLESNVEFSISGAAEWDNVFPVAEHVFDIARVEAPISSTLSETPAMSGNVKLMTWNIEYWPGGIAQTQSSPGIFNPKPPNVQMQLGAVKQILDDAQPDVLFLQEIYNLASLEYLRDSLNDVYPHVICTAYNFENDDPLLTQYQSLHNVPGDWQGIKRPPYRFECGMLSRYPVAEAREIELYEQVQVDPLNRRTTRGILAVTVLPPNQKPLHVYVVHPSHHPEMLDSRIDTIQLILEDLEARDLDPLVDEVVICGDVNTSAYMSNPEPIFEMIRESGFVDGWEGVYKTKRATIYLDPTSPKTLDYIFISESIQATRAKTVPNSGSPDKSNLRAGTTPGIASDHYAVKTELHPRQQTFAVIGDYGSGSIAQGYVANMVKEWDVDYIVTTGDNNYGDLLTQWGVRVGKYYGEYIQDDFSYPLGRFAFQTSTVQRFFPTIGNHDTPTFAGTGEHYLNYFHKRANGEPGRLPVGTGRHENYATYYDFVMGDVHFWMIDSEHARQDPQLMDEQKAWLKAGLAASDSIWNVVIAHNPAYSSGKHGSDELMQWPYAEWGADAFIAGHDHIYERIMKEGPMLYFVNGLGGARPYEFGVTVVGSAARYNLFQGAMKVTVDPERLFFEFYSIESGTLLVDQYELQQCIFDCDQSTGPGVMDVFDFLCFQSAFVAGESFACDCDTSTGEMVCDVFDFLCFQQGFIAGCQ